MACPNVRRENLVFGTSRFYYLEHDQSTDDPLQHKLEWGGAMKSLVALLFIVLAVPNAAQAPLQDAISIGPTGDVLLSLGQPKDSVLHALRERFQLDEMANGAYEISSGKGCLWSDCYGAVSFKQGRLSSVTKDWQIVGPDRGVAVVQAIRGAMASFGTACSVQTFDHQEPNVERSGVAIVCGRRQVQIVDSKATFDAEPQEGVVVGEVLSSGP